MPIEIVPKPKARPKSIVTLLFYLSLIVVILTITAYFSLLFLKNEKTQALEDLKNLLAKEKTQTEIKALEEAIGDKKRKIDDFSVLLNSHQSSTKFFKFLEENTHLKVRWLQMSLDLVEYKATLSGQANSFTTLTQQLLFLKKEPNIESLDLSDLLIGEEGGVEFSLKLSLSPQLFVFTQQ